MAQFACIKHGFIEPSSGMDCPACGDGLLDLEESADVEVARYASKNRRRRRQAAAIGVGCAAAIGVSALLGALDGAVIAVLTVLFFVPIERGFWMLTGRSARRLESWATGRRAAVAKRRWTGVPTLLFLSILISCAVLWQLGAGQVDWAIEDFGMIPANIRAGTSLHSLLTMALVHASLAHLSMNALGLLIWGVAVDLRVGRVLCLAVVLVSVVVGGVCEAYLTTVTQTPVVGISAGVYGLAGASLALMPTRPVPVVILGQTLFLPSWAVIVPLVIAFGTIDFLLPTRVAVFAHVGGFVTGAVPGFVLRRVPTPGVFSEWETERREAVEELRNVGV